MDYPAREEIRPLCTQQSFDRGVNCWKQGRIQRIDIDGEAIRATVRGSRDYDVSINLTDDTIRTHCSCPYDYAGDCKHIVAVLLAVDDRDIDTDTDSSDKSIENRPESVDVEALVEGTTADELRAFLLGVIEDDGHGSPSRDVTSVTTEDDLVEEWTGDAEESRLTEPE